MAAIEAYPLAWPVGRPRTPAGKREAARFGYRAIERSRIDASVTYERKTKLTIYLALRRVRNELEKLGATDVVVSTNVPTRNDGLPYSSSREPDDPACAVYFRLQGKVRCLPSDHWDRVADNLAAVAAHIAALRGIDRWRVGDIEQAWSGYLALPAMGAPKPWWTVLGFDRPPQDFTNVQAARERCLLRCHPDRGGNANEAAEVNAAFDEARAFYKPTT
jgi:hypothetical protein